jgi:hypothetical protein
VGVESEPGVGSTFYVSVPVQLDTGEAAHDGAQHAPSEAQSEAQSEAPNEAPAERATSGDGAS